MTGLLISYTFTGVSNPKPFDQKYTLPDSISVVEAKMYSKNRNIEPTLSVSPRYVQYGSSISSLERKIGTKNIDFSKDFMIKTNRYTLIKEEDWLLSQMIGKIVCIPIKIFFWDWDIGKGLDADRAKTALAFLENDKSIKDITVRLNHNSVWKDFYRLFFDEKVKERNNFLARATLGSLMCLKGELWAELARGDYYNAMTQTSVSYSNVESIIAHEIGHHKDFQRFTSDWEYTLARMIPPVMLYQEWKASTNARDLMSPKDGWQFNRYLMPAFLTYIFATYKISKRMIFGKRRRDDD